MLIISHDSSSISKTDDIKKCIEENEKKIEYIGLSNGFLGLSYYCYYDFLYTNNETSVQKMIYYIEKSIKTINEEYSSPFPQIEMIEMGLYLVYLYEQELLDEDIEGYLLELDEIIETYLLKKLEEGDLDNTVGFLKAGYYFIQRNNTDKNHLLHKILDRIENLCITDEDLCYWKFTLRNSENPTVELGLGHGVTGVISFLLHLFKKDIQKERCVRLLHSSINFVLSQEDKSDINWFPINAFENKKLGYHNLSYGDIGIGYVLYNAGEILGNKNYREKALLILENAAKFKDEERVHIKDANLIYGASGLCSVFNLLFGLTKNEKMLFAREYWHNKIMEFTDYTNPNWAGFNTYFNGAYEYAQLGFSQGITGIGITLLADEMDMNNDYLSFLNYNL